MSGDRPVIGRFSLHRRAFRGICAIISFALSFYIVLFPTNAYATTNELDDDYFSLVVEEIRSRGLPCSSGDIGHILYEDDLVTVLEVVCESGESYEIIDIYNIENIVIEPIKRISEEEMENYFNRISYSTT